MFKQAENKQKDIRINDMTQGNAGRQILVFMLPLMGGNILQQMYTVTDAVILGKGVGVEALSAVGATDWIYWFMLWGAAGFGMGFSVLVAQYFGEKQYALVRKSVQISVRLSLIAGAGLSVCGVVLAGPVLHLLNTPENIYYDARLYVSIMYIGIFILMQYNTFSCILRALGDSKTPFIGLVISTALNISLDLAFVLGFHWGVAGAAVASCLAQGVAALYCFYIMRKLIILKREKDDILQSAGVPMKKEIFLKGLATAFQYSIIAIGGIVVQYAINGFGFLYVAGFTATNKLYGVLETISLAMGSAMMVYTSQNYGAQNKERIRLGNRISLKFGITVSVIMGAILMIFGRPVLSMFVSASSDVEEQVLAISYRYLFIMSLFLIVLYVLNTYRNIILGLDRMKIVISRSACELLMRIMMAFLVMYLLGEQGLYFIEVTAWTGAAMVYFISYYEIMKKIKFNKAE